MFHEKNNRRIKMNSHAKKIRSLGLSLPLLPALGCPGKKSSGTAPDKVLLVTSFGTSYNGNQNLSIRSIEQALQKAYPGYEVRGAFTSQVIIDKLKRRDGVEIDNVTQAMDRLVAGGVREVIVQPTHMISGYEYDDLAAQAAPYAGRFDSFRVGLPLLYEDGDYSRMVSVLTGETTQYHAEDTAVVFMGHGTGHPANSAYAKLQQAFTCAGYSNYFIGTVEAGPSLDDVVALVKRSGAKRVVLLPLMIVAGDHANRDMAGEEAGSWKNTFEREGFAVECVLKGLGQYGGIHTMFVERVGRLLAR